jgi:hypothetical protein
MNYSLFNETIPESFKGVVASGVIGALVALGILIVLLVLLAMYIYFALAWKTIAEKRKYKKSWLAWIPFANLSMILQLGGFHWAWIFLVLVPILGWIPLAILLTISTWRVFEKLKYPGWLSLAGFIDLFPGISGLGTIAYLVVIGIVAWRKR